ncbi:MAG: hypothetical protein DWQ31_16865 [Planctomycetota bacterium]|nr:MAG: hypothetical protein DWQ31_16865 [Planctomycetota bacterium]REJ92026.1 MAG: hypothetical protein DWQ35_12815 [Planctomycetota bacterium]REK28562.1 MAG: hypothetical protein DWQ42_04405 [Planctomycetota bacterium]REK39177.1 MAG: hypothetical protein DWQ46_17990 [Planctomycetota bacterium]
MTPDAVLIQQPAIDFTTFLGLSHQMLGYSPGRAADSTRREFSDAERFLSCLAALRDEHAPAGITPNLLAHVSFSVFIAADERDLLDVLEAASGMSFVTAETLARGVHAAVITGTLNQWRDAVKTGTSVAREHAVRACYCKVMVLFERAGLAQVWADFTKKSTTDHLFYLEDKRKR